MANESRDDVTSVWKNQPVEPVEISLKGIRRKAQRLEKQVLWRNLREFGAAAIVIAAFAYYTWVFHSLLLRVGGVLEIAGTLFVVYTLHKRGSARTVPVEMAFRTCIEFHREELQRQRNLLRGVWTWYLLPFAPGLVVFLLGLFRLVMEQPNASIHAGRIATVFALTAVGCAVVFIGVARLNQWTALKIQHEIDALDAMEKES